MCLFVCTDSKIHIPTNICVKNMSLSFKKKFEYLPAALSVAKLLCDIKTMKIIHSFILAIS